MTGVDGRGRLARVTLRFRNEEIASDAATTILETWSVNEEPLPTAIPEIAAELNPRAPKFLMVWVVLAIIFGAWTFPRTLDPNLLMGWALLVIVVGLPFILPNILLPLINRPITVWLRQENDKVILRTANGSAALVPSKLEWMNPRSFTLWVRRKRMKLTFATLDDARRAHGMFRQGFPALEVVYAENAGT